MNRFGTVFMFCCVAGIGGSFIDFNETTFAELPPLFALDEWAQCQGADDVYCMVDAALTAKHQSTVLVALQEYSKDTMKHYNRSQIHRGLCVSHCGEQQEGTEEAWHSAAQRCLDRSLTKYNLQAQVLSVDWCTNQPRGETTGSARAFAVLCVVLVAVVMLATILHVLGDRCAKVDGNKYLLAFSLKRNWEILTYDRSRPRTDDRMKDLTCIEGIRFMGMQCVIFSHVLLIYVYSYTDNPQFIEKMYDQFGWQMVLNSPLWLQAFFSMSAFLTTYSVIITIDRSPITLFKCFMAIINRWIRLTPVAGVALWFTVTWYPSWGAGPQWNWLVGREAAECAERWWYHILYVHNHLPTGKFCMGHTWYLAADMQLHIFGLLLLVVLMRFRRAAVPILAALVAASAAAAGLVTYFNHLTPIVTAQTPEVLRTMFLGSKILTMVYLPSWMNLTGYASGMATAFVLHHVQANGLKLNQEKWFNILFHLSLTLGSCVVISGVVFLREPMQAAWASALYAALDRSLVAMAFNVFLLGCCLRCKSALREMFEWRGFHVLGRLSYSVFVIHFIVLRLTLAGNTQLNHASLQAMITLLISVSVISYIVAIPYCLLIELPAIQLWKAITTGERNERGEQSERRERSPVTSPLPALKPLDLVAHIRRRQEV